MSNRDQLDSSRKSALGLSGPVPVHGVTDQGPGASARAGLRGDHRGCTAHRSSQPHRRPPGPTCSTPACCSPTRARCAASRSTRSSLPVVVITELEGKRHHPELGYFARAALRALDELRVLHGRLDEPVPVGEAGGTIRVELNHTDPDLAALRLPARRQRLADPGGGAQPGPGGPRGHPGLQGPADADQGVRGGPRRRGVPRRAGRRVRLDRDGRGRGGLRRPRRAVRRRGGRPRGGPGPALPHRAGAALGPGQRAGPGQGRQAGAPGPRRPGRVRHPRPLRGAADRAGDAARPRGRHRLARRPRRHRQVRDGAVRRPGGGDGAPPAQEGGRLPAAVRRRRPGARLPARATRTRRCRRGARRSSTPSAR